jgi:hypothetical protein
VRYKIAAKSQFTLSSPVDFKIVADLVVDHCSTFQPKPLQLGLSEAANAWSLHQVRASGKGLVHAAIRLGSLEETQEA